MTQVKKTCKPGLKPVKKTTKKVLNPANSLQKQFLALSQNEQMGVTSFFNAHNIAHFIYENLSEEAQKYVSYCIRLSADADKTEKQNSAQVS